MVNSIPKYIFLTSLAITILIFVAGLVLGWNLDNMRTATIFEQLEANELDAESFIVEQAFVETVAQEESCDLFAKRLNSLSMQLIELGDDLTNYQKISLFKQTRYDYLVRRYFLLEMKAYTLYYELQSACDFSEDVILYFYSVGQTDSETQGLVLDRVVKESNKTLDVFSFNAEFEGEPALNALMLYYNVTQTPTLIINGEIKQEGFIGYDELTKLLV